MSDNPQNNRFGAGSAASNGSLASRIGASFFQRKSDSTATQNRPAPTFNRTTNTAQTSAFGSTANRSASTLSQRVAQNGNAIASVMRKTSQPNRAQFTPSTYPGITNLAMDAQTAGYDSISERNQDIQPTTQDRRKGQ